MVGIAIGGPAAKGQSPRQTSHHCLPMIANAHQHVANIKKEPAIQKAIASNKITVVGAFYEITSGAVDFFETEEDLRIAQTVYESCNWQFHLV